MRILVMALLSTLTSAVLGESSLERHRQALPEALVGSILIEQRNCHRCHGTGPSDGGPLLESVGTRLRHAAISRRILSPSGNMPALLDQLDEEARASTAAALAHYLRSQAPKQPEEIEGGEAVRGEELYHQVGCVACHGPEKAELTNVAGDYHYAGLVSFLENPLEAHPNGQMPDMQLTHWEARDLATYLLGDAKAVETVALDGGMVERGRIAYQEHQCATCHEPVAKQGGSEVSLASADLTQACLSQEAGPWPKHALTAWQQAAIVAAIEKPVEPSLVKPLVKHSCLACHDRDGLGGVPAALDTYFTSANLNLGEQARLPPSLDGVGAKLNPNWLHKVLEQGASVRPYMHTRMPVFGLEAMTSLADALSEQDEAFPLQEAPDLESREARQAGHQLVGVKGFGCVACHTFKGESTTTLNALDLTTMTARLQKPWFQRYLKDPPAFQPLTIMPSYWPNDVSTRPEILEGDPDKQIEALWDYLRHGRDARPPEGLKREPIILKVADEAVMLRRNYRDVGKRGIGVGYPSGIHLVFDAGQMRLASMWKGEFVEASGAFRGQGSGHVQPRSREVVKFPSGPAFAILTSPEESWPFSEAKKAEGFQFKGYELDEKRRPSFRYTFAGAEILDRFLDRKDEEGAPFFERTLTLSSEVASLYFLAAKGEQVVSKDEEYLVDKRLLVVPSSAAVVRNGAVLVPVSEKELTLIYRLLTRED